MTGQYEVTLAGTSHLPVQAQQRSASSPWCTRKVPERARMVMQMLQSLMLLALAVTASADSRRELQQASTPEGSPPSGGIVTDADILNFALNLEYLEASFYTCALTGSPLPDTLTGGGPTPTGCQKASLSDPNVIGYLTNLVFDEQAHVATLRSALGSGAVPIPQLDLGTAFAAAADAALNMTLSPPFNPYANDLFLLHGIFIFEDVGVTAYLGAAPLISSKDYLAVAASILAVEGYHAGIVRDKLIMQDATVTPYGVNVATIVDAISALRNTLSGFPSPMSGNPSTFDDEGITPSGTMLTPQIYVPTDNNGLVFARTPNQVLSIVYGMMGAMSGLFFPNGLNGNIK